MDAAFLQTLILALAVVWVYGGAGGSEPRERKASPLNHIVSSPSWQPLLQPGFRTSSGISRSVISLYHLNDLHSQQSNVKMKIDRNTADKKFRTDPVKVSIDMSKPVQTVDDTFVSYTIDLTLFSWPNPWYVFNSTSQRVLTLVGYTPCP